ncbi:hypothetical protein [Mucilaginibacter ginkgonis]|uniref:Viral A-type inclusion protein n=1 Tax=Mucilaginibacter ginkgonis TaxID=2682091 RepID=A0A6I4I2E3_9SPHI|nr:hypothetical protein [Mucilaginibacter ginkgonis]QQL50805.1 hypothetical protein GO620_004930 [Mucilaginibacter ginkgonis]
MQHRLKFLATLLTTLFFLACNSAADRKAEEKKIMDSIMTKHEKVMGDEEKLMENKMVIDSLIKTAKFDAADSAVKKTELRAQSKKLTDADEAMDNWMHGFDPNNAKHQGDAKLKYLQEQSQLMNKIDAQITEAVKSSTQFLAKPKK